MTADGLAIYRIPESNLFALRARVEKLNRRAAKLHMEPLVLAEIGEVFETRERSMRPTDSGDDVNYRARTVKYQVRFVLVTLAGTCPHVNGWAMAATIQHEEGGNILRTVPGFETSLPVIYRTASTGCDHCHTDRIRKDTYVLQSEAGEWKQVGRNCLADFLRTENAAGLAEYAELLAGLDSEMGAFEYEDFGGGHGQKYFATLDLLTQVACCVRGDGWCSRTEARNSYTPKQATVDTALSCFDEHSWNRMDERDRERFTVTEDDKIRATAAIAWAQELPADVTNDYLWNIRVVSHREQIGYREAGLAGSIIAAYNRYMEQELARKYEHDHPSAWFGTEGERGIFTLTVIGLREMEGNFGLTTLVQFRDSAGNRAKWFCSGRCSMEIDQPVTVKATIKTHEEYKGSKQTVLSRVALYDAAAEAEKKAAAKAAKKAARLAVA